MPPGCIEPPGELLFDIRDNLLAAAQLRAADVHYVVLSHLHRDHTGW